MRFAKCVPGMRLRTQPTLRLCPPGAGCDITSACRNKGGRFMFSVSRTVILTLGCGLLLSACGGGKPGSAAHSGGAADAGRVLNLYIWSDYLAPTTLPRF